MTHLNPHGESCECGFGERLLAKNPWGTLSGSLTLSKTDSDPWEGKMFHGSQSGLLGPVRPPFWTTSHEPEAQKYGPVTHPVSVRFQNPYHSFLAAPEEVEKAQQGGHDGMLVHLFASQRDPQEMPSRKWAIALDPGTVVPGHDHEWPYG